MIRSTLYAVAVTIAIIATTWGVSSAALPKPTMPAATDVDGVGLGQTKEYVLQHLEQCKVVGNQITGKKNNIDFKVTISDADKVVSLDTNQKLDGKHLTPDFDNNIEQRLTAKYGHPWRILDSGNALEIYWGGDRFPTVNATLTTGVRTVWIQGPGIVYLPEVTFRIMLDDPAAAQAAREEAYRKANAQGPQGQF